MRTNVYIDGFNLYYGLFSNKKRRLPWKWLDLRALSGRLLPRQHSLHRLRYFTADLVARSNDLEQPVRQQAYLHALGSIPELSVHKGNFLTSAKPVRPVQPLQIPQLHPPIRIECSDEIRRTLDALRTVRVWSTEEKGSDVNLASYLMHDVATSDCDAVMIISNDSDLATPLRLAKSVWQTEITVVNPHPGKPTELLRQLADNIRSIRPEVVRNCQFPDEIIDARGRTIRKPRKWARDEQRYLARVNN